MMKKAPTPRKTIPASPCKSDEFNNNFKLIVDNFKSKKEQIAASADNPKKISEFGLYYQTNHTVLVDDFISKLLKALFQKSSAEGEESFCLIATGGYGRNELAPWSDVDILFLLESPANKKIHKLVESLTAAFWETGLKLSASVRTIEECLNTLPQDLHFLTSLLDMRLIAGSSGLFRQLRTAIQQDIKLSPPGQFIAAKLEEQEARHKKFGDTRFYLEPNIKESKGGLRDLQTLFWLSDFIYGIKSPEDLKTQGILTSAESESLRRALHFFWTVRCHLHLIAGRPDDRLAFDIQPRIAARMGYKDTEPNIRAEKFMHDYFHMANETGYLTRILCTDLESRAFATGTTAGTRKLALEETIDGFPVRNNRLTIENPAIFKKTPLEIIRIFRVAQTSGLDIHSDALRAIRSTLKADSFLPHYSAACHLFLDILLDKKGSEKTLRRLNEAGVLSILIPDFANIHAHMQYDMYHVFTADEHTIRAVGMMHKLENGGLTEQAPLVSEIFKKIQSRRALYAAMFLHDIAKGTGGQHSTKGSSIAKRLCPKLGLSPTETETVAWLVRQHLLMTMTALKHDLNDPKTISDFAAEVQSPERLKLLYILTVSDIMAVGPDRWNNWKAVLLADLYERTTQLLSGVALPPPETTTEMMRGIDKTRLEKEPAVIVMTPDTRQDSTEVKIYTPDRKGLFALLSGSIAASGASIVDARIYTLADCMALDVFRVQGLNGKAYDNTPFMKKMIKAALNGKIDLDAEILACQKTLSKKDRPFAVAPRIFIDNDASNSHTVIEINGKDRPGLLYDITSALSAEGLQIFSAKVTTFGNRALDVFYVRDGFGLKIIHPEKISHLEKTLFAALAPRRSP